MSARQRPCALLKTQRLGAVDRVAAQRIVQADALACHLAAVAGSLVQARPLIGR